MDDLFNVIKALSDETRFKMINILLSHDYCVGALAKNLGITKAAVSQHLQQLRKAEVVRGEKRGYWTHYTVNREMLRRAGDTLIELANQGSIAEKCPKQHQKDCCHGQQVEESEDNA